jgi:hypothetical protein
MGFDAGVAFTEGFAAFDVVMRVSLLMQPRLMVQQLYLVSF